MQRSIIRYRRPDLRVRWHSLRDRKGQLALRFKQLWWVTVACSASKGHRLVCGRSRFPSRGARRLDCLKQPGCLPFGVAEPVGAPNSVQPPSLAFQNFLPQPITISRTPSAVVDSSVALDPKNEAPRLLRIEDAQIDPET